MCLAIPSKIVQLKDNNTAVVDTMGVRRQVSLDLLQEEVSVGDYVLIHVGFAIRKLDEEEAIKTLKLFEEIFEEELLEEVGYDDSK